MAAVPAISPTATQVYTTARTIEGRMVAYEHQRDRLARGASKVGLPFSESELKKNLSVAMKEFFRKNEKSTEARLTVRVSKDALSVSVEALPFLVFPTMVDVCLPNVKASRTDPDVKSTSWQNQREELFGKISLENINEFLLVDEQNRLLEGASSNVFLVRNRKVATASTDFVLDGTVRGLVVKCCEKLKIPLNEFDAPSLNDLMDADEAFLTSTSRLVLPIGRVLNENGKIVKEFHSKSIEITTLLYEAVLKALKNDAVDVVNDT